MRAALAAIPPFPLEDELESSSSISLKLLDESLVYPALRKEPAMTDTQNTSKPASTPRGTRTPWLYRLPSARRFVLWNLFCWFFGASALVGGILYTEYVVRPVAEQGGTSFTPTEVFTKKNAAARVFGSSDRMNILVLGIDYNYDEKGILYTKGARSDTMMVVSLSRKGDLLNVVSIPRDTQVFIGEDYGYDKINSAYSYGGVEQARKVVSSFLGVPIHHHLVVKVSGAKTLIDALGGLYVDVEKDLDYDDNWGHLHIHLKKGPQILNGEQAVGYARFRMDEEGDRGRIRRQQQVIRALGGKLKEPALVTRFPEIAAQVKKTLETDLKPMEMVDLANLFSAFDFKQMRSGAIVGDDAMDANGVSYILPYAPENERTVRRLLKSLDWVTKGDLRIRIVFKKASPDVAYRLADLLADSGFDGVQVQALEDSDPRDTRTTYLTWFNKVSRLEGILKSLVGSDMVERGGKQDSGRDDDLLIVVGDHEKGDWAEVPAHLKQSRPVPNYRDESRYNGDFVPRQLPPSRSNYDEPYAPPEQEEAPIVDEPDSEDVMEQSYPTVTSPPPAPEPPPVVPESPPSEPVAPEPQPVEVAPPPAPVEPAPLPAATPVREL